MAGVVMVVHLVPAPLLARGTPAAMRTFGGTRLSPRARAWNEPIERERVAAE
jgi:hypothetical protein